MARSERRHEAINLGFNKGPCFGANDLCLDLDNKRRHTSLNNVYLVPSKCPGDPTHLFAGPSDDKLNDVEVLVASGSYMLYFEPFLCPTFLFLVK